MFGQCPIFACLGLRSILMLCEQTKTGEDGVLTEYLLFLKIKPRDINDIYPWNTEKHMYGYLRSTRGFDQTKYAAVVPPLPSKLMNPLLMPQGVDGIHSGRLQGREIAEHHAHGG